MPCKLSVRLCADHKFDHKNLGNHVFWDTIFAFLQQILTTNPTMNNEKFLFMSKFPVKSVFSEHFSSDSLCNFLSDFEKRVVNEVKT